MPDSPSRTTAATGPTTSCSSPCGPAPRRRRTGAPPDLFRVTYNDVGLYRDQGVLATLDPETAQTLEPSFAEQFWAAVTNDGGTFGVPHHTDTTMVLLNTEALSAAGVGQVPDSPEGAWTWAEFTEVARSIRSSAPSGRYAAAINWQQAGAYRWLNFVDQAGGRLLTEDLTDAASDSAAVVEAMRFTRDLFRDGLRPASGLPKSSQYTDQLFTAETVAMAFVGNFSLPGMDIPFEWQPTYLPQEEQTGADLGGNALVAVDGPRQEAATAFLAYCVGAQQQADYCAATGVLPTRTDIDTATLDFPIDADVMASYAQQSETVSTELVRQVTVPQFNAVNRVLVDQLELSFVNLGDSDTERVRALLDAVSAEVSR